MTTIEPTSTPQEDAIITEQWLLKAAEVCEAASRGNFEARLLNFQELLTESESSPTLIRVLHSINDLLDVADAFVRESQVSLEYASEEKYHRRLLEAGLLGSYRNAARTINSATAVMATKSAAISKAEKERKELAKSLAGSSSDMTLTASQLGEIANATSELSDRVAQVSQDSSSKIESVAAAAEEFTGTIAGVSDLVNTADKIAIKAVKDVQATHQHILALSNASEQISSVSQLIQQITRQTSLLSINASVEAARAGDAGRGFAVVATEVKSLSSETAAAAKGIQKEISGIQEATDNVVSMTAAFSVAVEEFAKTCKMISTAVDEQKIATAVIHDGVQSSAKGAQEVLAAIEKVSDSAGQTSEVATQLLNSAQDLAEEAQKLGE